MAEHGLDVIHRVTESFFALLLGVPLIEDENDSTATLVGQRADFFVLVGQTFLGVNHKEDDIAFVQGFDCPVY